MTDTALPATPNLTIERVDVTVLSQPLVPPFRAAIRSFERIITIIAEVHTRNGPGGIATGFAFSEEDAAVIVAAIDMLRPLIAGYDASRPKHRGRQWQAPASSLAARAPP